MTLDCFSISRGSFTQVSTEWSESPDLKMTLMLYFLHTHLMSSLMPVVYGSFTKGDCSPLPAVSHGNPPHVGVAERPSR